MTEIKYTSKAKDDLARINWKTREKIISTLSAVYEKKPSEIGFKQMHGSELVRLNYEEHVIIGQIEASELNIITIQKSKEIRLPE